MTNLGYDNDCFAIRETTLKEAQFVAKVSWFLKDIVKSERNCETDGGRFQISFYEKIFLVFVTKLQTVKIPLLPLNFRL